MPNQAYDWRALLKRYMEEVWRHEGVHFIDLCNFTPEEEAALREVAKDV